MEYGAIGGYHGFYWGRGRLSFLELYFLLLAVPALAIASPSLLTFAFHHKAWGVVFFHQAASLIVVDKSVRQERGGLPAFTI